MTDHRLEVITQLTELRTRLADIRRQGQRIGLVPTMGALHEGHLSLVRASVAECDQTVVTIYVNPSQFAPTEDFDQYPRTLQTDLDALAGCGSPLVFVPSDKDVYRPGHATWVEVGLVSQSLEGRRRPDFFRGVATIVLKLFNMVGPDVAYFGQKDYQQSLVIRRMIKDLNIPIELCVCPTIREPDGLAVSSRNAYLSDESRRNALVLWKSLQLANRLVKQGERRAEAIAEKMREIIETVGDVEIDYIALVDPETLDPVEQIRGRTLAALAIRIEQTWLIDNCLLQPPES